MLMMPMTIIITIITIMHDIMFFDDNADDNHDACGYVFDDDNDQHDAFDMYLDADDDDGDNADNDHHDEYAMLSRIGLG